MKLLVVVCLFILKVNGKSFESVVISGYPDEQDISPIVTDRFGMSEDEYNGLKEKAKEYRTEYARHYNQKLPDEPLMSSILFGDILYTEDQLRWLISALPHGPHSRKKRKIIDYRNAPSKQWKGMIPYTFSDSYEHNEYQKAYIRHAMSIWESETCVRFLEFHISQAPMYKDYVYIEKKLGCYSHYGRIGGRQLVGLGPSCFTEDGYGYAIHELGHVLGLYHEHSRYDRDEYVTIMSSVRTGEEHNFRKYYKKEITTYGLPYDYSSVMHYGSRSFSLDRGFLDTIRSLDPLYQWTMGQRYRESFLDSKTVNLAYCQDTCSTPLPCKRGGYVDPNHCNACKCPDGFQGRYCQELVPSSPDVCYNTGVIYSRREPTCTRIGPYNNNTECTWLLKAPDGCEVDFWFEDEFDVLLGSTAGPTCFHYVEVQYKGPPTTPGPRFCGHSPPLFDKLTSVGGDMLVIFRTPQLLTGEQLPGGFTMCHQLIDSCVVRDNPSSFRVPGITARYTSTITRKNTRELTTRLLPWAYTLYTTPQHRPQRSSELRDHITSHYTTSKPSGTGYQSSSRTGYGTTSSPRYRYTSGAPSYLPQAGYRTNSQPPGTTSRSNFDFIKRTSDYRSSTGSNQQFRITTTRYGSQRYRGMTTYWWKFEPAKR